MTSAEIKANIDDIIKYISNMFKIVIPPLLVHNTIKKFYDKGLEEMEFKFSMNFTRDPKRVELLQNYVVENIKDMNVEMMNKIRKEITQGVVNLESIPSITKRIQEVVDVSKDRARMIARTETNRALNMGHKDAALQAGFTKKEWVAHIDNRTSAVCRALNGQVVGINKKFKHNGEEFDIPPAHVNCRSRVIYY